MQSRENFQKGRDDAPTRLAFLLDVDNTLLDNDRLKDDVDRSIDRLLGEERARRFWEVYEEVRRERDYVDFPHTIDRVVAECNDPEIGRELNDLLTDWPFSLYVYPRAFQTIEHLKAFGTVVIVSDGDRVFQPRKIRQSGLEAAVDGNVLVYVHKEEQLQDVFTRYSADTYVAVDDKPRIIAALEEICPSEFTTILVLQGKYAEDQTFVPKPDYVIKRIGDLEKFSREDFVTPHLGQNRDL